MSGEVLFSSDGETERYSVGIGLIIPTLLFFQTTKNLSLGQEPTFLSVGRNKFLNSRLMLY